MIQNNQSTRYHSRSYVAMLFLNPRKTLADSLPLDRAYFHRSVSIWMLALSLFESTFTKTVETPASLLSTGTRRRGCVWWIMCVPTKAKVATQPRRLPEPSMSTATSRKCESADRKHSWNNNTRDFLFRCWFLAPHSQRSSCHCNVAKS